MSTLKNYLLSLMLLVSCSSPETHGSGEDSTPDTSYYVPEGSISAISEAKVKTDTVEISEMKFHPEEIHVNQGDTIIWINHDLVSHCVTEEVNKTWTSSSIPAGGSWKMAITKDDSYYCAIHLVMKGRIVLESDQLRTRK